MRLVSKKYAYVDSEALFALVADQAWSIFLDSGVTAANQELKRKHAGFDVLACAPSATLVYECGKTLVKRAEQIISNDRLGEPSARTSREPSARISKEPLARIGKEPSAGLDEEPLAVLRQLLAELEDYAADEDDQLAYKPGLLGYFAYDYARSLENIPELSVDEEQIPDIAMGLYPTIVTVDHTKRETRLIYCEDYPNAEQLASDWGTRIEQVLTVSQGKHRQVEPSQPSWSSQQINSGMSFADYAERFEQVQAYIRAGDCYQVNLTKRFSTHVHGDAWSSYLKLRRSSPAPYGAFLNLPFAQVLSNSPESFIQCRERAVVTSPIKGTRPRDYRSKYKDRQAADSLINSTKDRAENLMIVDLMRNDLSRCCELGSVKVPKLFSLHSFANVHHLISTVVGTLQVKLHALDLLKACFPGGSITGAPKIRAMEIIEELEPTRRGVYCGSITYLGLDGNLETNIAIRTMVHKDGVVRFSAGGGLVLDSEVGAEYQELLDKASMMSSLIDLSDESA